MARTAVAITDLTINTAVAAGAGTSLDATNDHVITLAGDHSGIVLRVTNTHTAAHTVTLKAGTNPPSVREGLGDLTFSVPADTGDVFVSFEPGRYIQATGLLHIDIEANHAGKIWAYKVPKLGRM